MPSTDITTDITINGETVRTELIPIPVGASTGMDFLARTATGTKLYRVGMVLRPAKSKAPDTVDTDGNGWLCDYSASIRNRPARIVAVATPSSDETHNYGEFISR